MITTFRAFATGVTRAKKSYNTYYSAVIFWIFLAPCPHPLANEMSYNTDIISPYL